MTLEVQNAAVIRRFYDELWNERRLDLADEILAVGDRVVTRMTWTGTHRGPLGDVEPTGAQIEYPGACLLPSGERPN